MRSTIMYYIYILAALKIHHRKRQRQDNNEPGINDTCMQLKTQKDYIYQTTYVS